MNIREGFTPPPVTQTLTSTAEQVTQKADEIEQQLGAGNLEAAKAKSQELQQLLAKKEA